MKNFNSAIFLILVILSSCSLKTGFQRDKELFERSAVIQKFKSAGDGVDSYFQLKENRFCEFYVQLFDSLKTTVYPGKYINRGDTLLLQFYNRKAYELLGRKAIINQSKKEIIFFNEEPGKERHYIIF